MFPRIIMWPAMDNTKIKKDDQTLLSTDFCNLFLGLTADKNLARYMKLYFGHNFNLKV